MAWPVAAGLLLMALAGCVAATAALMAAWTLRDWALATVGVAILASLAAEVAALNGWWGPTMGGGVAVVTVLAGGVALAALAVHLLLPPPIPVAVPAPATGAASNPDSEA